VRAQGVECLVGGVLTLSEAPQYSGLLPGNAFGPLLGGFLGRESSADPVSDLVDRDVSPLGTSRMTAQPGLVYTCPVDVRTGCRMLAIMLRRPPPSLCFERTPALSLLCALLVGALAMPGIAIASHRSPTARPAGVPSCKGFSLTKLAHAIHVGSLELEGSGPAGNLCLYKTPHVADHYADLLSISLVATDEAVFLRARQRARYSPVQHQQAFGNLNSRGVKAFYVITGYSSQGLGPCRSPGATLPEFGPPLCEGQPSWYTYPVYSYGTLGGNGPKTFVSVAFSSEPITGAIAIVSSLNRKILSGQIH
jgi:hypothetical protein